MSVVGGAPGDPKEPTITDRYVGKHRWDRQWGSLSWFIRGGVPGGLRPPSPPQRYQMPPKREAGGRVILAYLLKIRMVEPPGKNATNEQ